ncbi:MAG: NAD(P)/FAD-dependent oxidoreductase [Christensenellales bacterium]|jgi:predicted Rossmann fold flavoprotein
MNIVVIGGGASGMMAAIFAAKKGANTTLLERNEKLGKKLYITGKGRCNLTNDCDKEQFMKNIVRNPKFLYAALAKLDNLSLMDMIENAGTPLKIERGGRVFPASDRASDITRALEKLMAQYGVRTVLHARAEKILTEGGRVTGVFCGGRAFPADAAILCCGGLSYPSTGSTGDGLSFARELGHTVTPTRPALVPIETKEDWPKELTGLTLKNVELSAYQGGKRAYKERGEMLFTHFGISGPLVLTCSSVFKEPIRGTQLFIDLKPALDEGELDARLLRDFQAMQKKRIAAVMDGLAPHSLGCAILRLCNISEGFPVDSVTAEMRRNLIKTIKALPLTAEGLRGYGEAVITRGGVDVKEISSKTLESKIVRGLYFAGETLDVDAFTGGFNLQIAFSTGALAGDSAASE